jgi:hypothetical protein
MSSNTRRGSRNLVGARTYILLTLVAVIIAILFLKIVFVVQDKWGHDAFIRWGGLVGFTLGIFGLFVGHSEQVLQEWRFWVLIAILLVVHLVAFAIVLSNVEEWKLTWFMGMVIEYPVFLFLRNKFVCLPRSNQ